MTGELAKKSRWAIIELYTVEGLMFKSSYTLLSTDLTFPI